MSRGVAESSLAGWAERRRRARQLRERWPFAAEMLGLYAALLDTQERAFVAARDDPPDPANLAVYVSERVMPGIIGDTIAAGPPLLADACRVRAGEGPLRAPVRRWLAGEAQSPVDEYLARAATGPVLEALGAAAGLACHRRTDARGCPRCGGPPQLSYIAEAGDPLLTPPRRLLCVRCGESWIHERMTCPGCGETSSAKLPIYAEPDTFPHVRADGCETCRHYLLTIDLRKEPEAVPVVDELAGLPLDLHLRELGFAKIASNLMGIG